MSGTIRRGTPPARRLKQQPSRRRQPKVSMIDRALAALPVSQETLQRAIAWVIVGLVGLVGLAAAAYAHVPQMIGTALGERIGDAGFRVARVQVVGAKHADRAEIYNLIWGTEKARSIALIDLHELRSKLVTDHGWIADARVSRRLPDMLLVDIVERTPAAVWQNHGRQMLVDANGAPLEEITPGSAPGMPLLIGEGASAQAPAYEKLLDAAPALKPSVKAAIWQGNRRWDLLFMTGETLMLPEDNPEAALRLFAKNDGADHLLGKGWTRFDMRDPNFMRAKKPGALPEKTITGPAGQPSTPATTTNGSIPGAVGNT